MLSMNPLPMALTVLVISILAAMLIFKKMMVSWLAFVFILTFSSGMMALFIYVSSLAPNEKMKIKKSSWGILILSCFLMAPLSTPETMKTTMKMFSNQFLMMAMALIILLSMLAILSQSYSPHQTAASNF